MTAERVEIGGAAMNAKWAKSLTGGMWASLNKSLTPRAVYYLHERYSGGDNDKWAGIMRLIEDKEYLNDEYLRKLKEGIYGE